MMRLIIINKHNRTMKHHIFKSIVIGVVLGAAFFFAPIFILKAMIIMLIISVMFRLIAGRWSRRGHGLHFALADTIRNMSDEEYNRFKQDHRHYGCGPSHSNQQKKNDDNPHQ